MFAGFEAWAPMSIICITDLCTLHSTKYIYIISLFKASWYPLSLLQSRKFYFHNKTVQWIFKFIYLLNVLHLFIGNNGPKIYNLLAPDKLMTTPVRIYTLQLCSCVRPWRMAFPCGPNLREGFRR